MNQVIELEDETDRWKWRCPAGHTTWEPTNCHFWCAQCARVREVDGVFTQLRNERTGELAARDEIVLLTPAGPYRDVRKGQGGSV